MKKLLVLLFILFYSSVNAGSLAVIGGQTVADAGTSYLLDEDFEGSGLPTDWTGTNTDGDTLDYDSTAGNAPLAGTYSLFMSDDNDNGIGPELQSPDFTAASTFSIYMLTNLENLPSDDVNMIELYDSGDTMLARIYRKTDGRYVCYHGTDDAALIADMTVGTTYNLWLDYVAGTGVNGTLRLYVSTNGTKGTVDAEITAGTSTGSVSYIILGAIEKALGIITDNILADDEILGDQ